MSRHASLYVHFPWCVQKCPYCDFNSHPLHGSLQVDRYLAALLADLADQQERFGVLSPNTIFLGGGTPSLFPPEAFGKLLDACGPASEVTMEANPGTTEHADFAAYRQAGINRLSLGAQTFDPDALVRLGRIHSADDTERAMVEARSGGFDRINVDLMYALPGQSVAAAIADLERAIALEPDHISWYQLTIEPKTAFYQSPPVLPVDDAVADIEAAGWALLRSHGYARYEVSAWCRPQQECQHNLNYWRFGDYIGIGAGAHGKLGRLRTEKAKAPSRYMSAPEQLGERTIHDDEVVFEALMNMLRLEQGCSWQTFEAATSTSRERLHEQWGRAVRMGLVEAERVQATALGYRHLDSVLAMFLDG